MSKLNSMIFAVAVTALCGCAAAGKPMVWKDPDAQISKNTPFEIRPVENKTGKNFEKNIASILTTHLKEQFKEKSLKVVDNASSMPAGYFVESDLLVYVEGSAFKRWLAPGAGKTQCTLKTRLIDKSTNKMVLEVVVAKEVGAGGLYSVGAENWILKDAASDVADEIAKAISGDN